MKTLLMVLKVCFYADIGVFLGRALYETFWYRNHPELYELNSAPWYTNILVCGVFALVFAAALGAAMLIVKMMMHRKG